MRMNTQPRSSITLPYTNLLTASNLWPSDQRPHGRSTHLRFWKNFSISDLNTSVNAPRPQDGLWNMLDDHSLLTSKQEEQIGHLLRHLPTGLLKTIMADKFPAGKLILLPTLTDAPLWNTSHMSHMSEKFEELDSRSVQAAISLPSEPISRQFISHIGARSITKAPEFSVPWFTESLSRAAPVTHSFGYRFRLESRLSQNQTTFLSILWHLWTSRSLRLRRSDPFPLWRFWTSLRSLCLRFRGCRSLCVKH